jgi:hypothetical protein
MNTSERMEKHLYEVLQKAIWLLDKKTQRLNAIRIGAGTSVLQTLYHQITNLSSCITDENFREYTCNKITKEKLSLIGILCSIIASQKQDESREGLKARVALLDIASCIYDLTSDGQITTQDRENLKETRSFFIRRLHQMGAFPNSRLHSADKLKNNAIQLDNKVQEFARQLQEALKTNTTQETEQ